MQEVKDAGMQASSMDSLSTDEVVDVYVKSKQVSGVHVPNKGRPLMRMEHTYNKVVSTKNKELSFKFLDELKAKKKIELSMAAASTPKEVKSTLGKKVWNPLKLDLNAGTQSRARSMAKQVHKRNFHRSFQPFGNLFAKTKAAKVEPLMEVPKMEEFVELELLEALDEQLIANDDKVEAVVATNVEARGGMQEVLSMKSVIPTSDNKCHAP